MPSVVHCLESGQAFWWIRRAGPPAHPGTIGPGEAKLLFVVVVANGQVIHKKGFVGHMVSVTTNENSQRQYVYEWMWLLSNKTLFTRKQAAGQSGLGLRVSDPESLSCSFLLFSHSLNSSTDLLNNSLIVFISFLLMMSLSLPLEHCTYFTNG